MKLLVSLLTIVTLFSACSQGQDAGQQHTNKDSKSAKTMTTTNRPVTEAKGLSVGTKAPLFEATDQQGNTYMLSGALKKGRLY